METINLSIGNEKILMEKRANHQGKILSHGGKLILTTKRLYFKPHRFNIGGNDIIIELNNIIDFGKTQTMFGTSKEMWINLKGGVLVRFVVWGREEILQTMKKQIALLNKNS